MELFEHQDYAFNVHFFHRHEKNGIASTRPKLAILWRHGSVPLARTGSGYFWAGCENHSPTSVFNHNSSSHLNAPWRCVKGTGSASKAQLASTWTGRSNWEWRADVRTSHLHHLHLKRPKPSEESVTSSLVWWPLGDYGGVQNTDTVWPSFRHTVIVFKAKPIATNLEVLVLIQPAHHLPARLLGWVVECVTFPADLICWLGAGGRRLRETFLTKGGDFWEERQLPFSQTLNRNSVFQEDLLTIMGHNGILLLKVTIRVQIKMPEFHYCLVKLFLRRVTCLGNFFHLQPDMKPF